LIHAVDSDTALRLLQHWLNRGDLSFRTTPRPLSPEEQRGVQTHRRVRLLVTPYVPPCTRGATEDELRGSRAERLKLVSLPTG
ncbi:hypothetical protein Q6298_28590, partial [Klebsiella pneumoniae]|uniref:hypothetical protein n=1 Tax=Klebsiella pneumoniae TaxID=573 RepID=UPI00273093D9